MTASTRERFEQYLWTVRDRLAGDDRILGLVGMGSTAERHRVDEWSDHDLAIITSPGSQDEVRHERWWLPDADRIVLDVIEWHGGGTLVFDDGRVIEFGVASPDELSVWSVHHHDVLFDRGGVAEAVARAIARSPRNRNASLADELALVVAKVHLGAGKARRGETLAASALLRGDAVTHLLTAVAVLSPEDDRADRLDPRRRLNLTHPDLAVSLSNALRLEEVSLARRLLDLGESLAGDCPEFPHAALAAVRTKHGWA
ncbi:MAG: hypothetical protein RJQ01_02870 [Microcella sp.]|uniref:hypothetical protein n=1 Tax=Microcella sp. TaxID=1913979 RepID=UPI00331505F1